MTLRPCMATQHYLDRSESACGNPGRSRLVAAEGDPTGMRQGSSEPEAAAPTRLSQLPSERDATQAGTIHRKSLHFPIQQV